MNVVITFLELIEFRIWRNLSYTKGNDRINEKHKDELQLNENHIVEIFNVAWGTIYILNTLQIRNILFMSNILNINIILLPLFTFFCLIFKLNSKIYHCDAIKMYLQNIYLLKHFITKKILHDNMYLICISWYIFFIHWDKYIEIIFLTYISFFNLSAT